MLTRLTMMISHSLPQLMYSEDLAQLILASRDSSVSAPGMSLQQIIIALNNIDIQELSLSSCIYSYQGEGGVSNMVIISVNMISGWQADRTALKTLVKEGKVDRYEVDEDGTVQIYLLKVN